MKFAIKVATSKKGNKYKALGVFVDTNFRILGFVKDFDGCMLLNLTAYEYATLADGVYYIN